MKEYTFSGIMDLWNDYTSVILTREVNLVNAKIYQVLNANYSEEKAIANAVVTDVKTQKQKCIRMKTSKKIAQKLELIGCFFEIDKERYLPDETVIGRSMYDYFRLPLNMMMNGLSEKENAILLAARFRKVKKIVFVYRKGKVFNELIGMQSVNGSRLNVMELAKDLDENHNVRFFSDYVYQKTPTDFTFMADLGIRNEDIPLVIRFQDDLSGRKPIKADLIANVEGRRFILSNNEIRHNSQEPVEDIIKRIVSELDLLKDMPLKPTRSVADIEEMCLPYVPKNAHQRFRNAIEGSRLEPIEAAYDLIESDLFNLKRKRHKTRDYDGGKRKYELALGELLVGK